MGSQNLSTLQRLRQGVQQRFEADLLARVQGAVAAAASGGDEWGVGAYEVWLFGSRARGDWDGRSEPICWWWPIPRRSPIGWLMSCWTCAAGQM